MKDAGYSATAADNFSNLVASGSTLVDQNSSKGLASNGNENTKGAEVESEQISALLLDLTDASKFAKPHTHGIASNELESPPGSLLLLVSVALDGIVYLLVLWFCVCGQRCSIAWMQHVYIMANGCLSEHDQVRW